MKIKIVILAVCVLFSYAVFSQQANYELTTSLYVNAYSSKHNDLVSGFINYAGLASSAKNELGLYGEQRFMLKEISALSLLATAKTHYGNFGFDAGVKGLGGYSQFKFGGIFSRQLDKRISAAIRYGYINSRMSKLSKEKFLLAGVSLMFHPSTNIITGCHVEHYYDVSKGLEKIELPVRYGFGFGYDVSNNFFIGVMINKQSEMPVAISPGILYSISKKMSVRFGFSGDTQLIGFGFDLFCKEYRLHLFFTHHPQLGITPGVLINTAYKKNDQ